MSATCVFCRRLSESDYIGCGRGVVRFEPLNPVVEGHMLFVHNVHSMDAASQPWITGIVFEVAAEYAERECADFNLITSAGPDATQTVNHLHVHYVPRHAEDGLSLPWTGQSK